MPAAASTWFTRRRSPLIQVVRHAAAKRAELCSFPTHRATVRSDERARPPRRYGRARPQLNHPPQAPGRRVRAKANTLATVRARKCRALRVRIPKKHRRVPIFENIFWGHFRKQPQLEESLPIKHAAPLQDAGVTVRRPLEFTTWRAVCRLTQVRRGRGAKRGELRGAARAGQPYVSYVPYMSYVPYR